MHNAFARAIALTMISTDMPCWKKLRLHTLPYWSQIEVCLLLKPLEVIAHHTYGTSKVQTGCIAGMQKLANTEKRMREKGTIFQEGVDDDRSIYIIVEGTVRLSPHLQLPTTFIPATAVLTLRIIGAGGSARQPIVVSRNLTAHAAAIQVDIFYEKDRHKILRLEKGDCFGESCLLYLEQETPYTRNYSAGTSPRQHGSSPAVVLCVRTSARVFAFGLPACALCGTSAGLGSACTCSPCLFPHSRRGRLTALDA